MFFHGVDKEEPRKGGDKDGGGSKGDGLHHHEIHEDEGGGYHSKHTDPEGNVEHGDHADMDDATEHMHQKFGHGEPDADDEDRDEDEGEDDGGDMSLDDIAGSYGRAHSDD